MELTIPSYFENLIFSIFQNKANVAVFVVQSEGLKRIQFLVVGPK